MTGEWKDILELLPTLLMLFLIILSPTLMGIIQKKIKEYEEKKRSGKDRPPPEEPLESSEGNQLLSSNPPGRTLQDKKETTETTSALHRIEKLPPLQRAVIWAEILGPPGGISTR